jgi:hypothetical protein
MREHICGTRRWFTTAVPDAISWGSAKLRLSFRLPPCAFAKLSEFVESINPTEHKLFSANDLDSNLWQLNCENGTN